MTSSSGAGEATTFGGGKAIQAVCWRQMLSPICPLVSFVKAKFFALGPSSSRARRLRDK